MKPDSKLLEKLEELKYPNEVNIENILKTISVGIEKGIGIGNKKFKKLEEDFNKEFPKETALRGASEALTWALLDTALELYFVGNNSALFVELHSFLERFALQELPTRLVKDGIAKSIISELVERKTLSDMSECFGKLNIWNDEDLKFVKKLSNIRNGIVHKNVRLVSKHLGDGSATRTADIYGIVNKVDASPYIVKTIKLLVKLSGVVEGF